MQFGVRNGSAVRWEPPHSCGERFSAGQSSVAASTIDSARHQPSSTLPHHAASIPDRFKDSPSGHDFSRAARLRIDKRLQPLGQMSERKNSAPSKARATSSRRTRPSGIGSSHRPRSLRILQFRRNPPADFRRDLSVRPLNRRRNRYSFQGDVYLSQRRRIELPSPISFRPYFLHSSV